ncbi:MAG: acyltransferase [Acidobacteria bacterium]|nr:acyltransferase [Acidobacteriota bacterium]
MVPAKESHPAKRVFFPNLDGLRFFAFFLVYLQHGFFAAVPVGRSDGFLYQLREVVFDSGWAGVSFFFVLSGFLITYLMLTEAETTGRIDIKAFYVRRALRIWPLYFLLLAFSFILYPAASRLFGGTGYVDSGSPLYYVFFLSNFDVIRLTREGRGEMFLGATWSVAVEEQFYLVWPLLLSYTPPKFYKYLLVVIILLSAAFRFRHLGDQMVINFHTLSVISDMAVGGLAAYLSLNSARFREALARIPMPLILATYLLGVSALAFRKQIFAGHALGSLQRLAFSLFFVFIVLEQSYSRHSPLKAGALKTISKLGVYTYGLYLLHAVAAIIAVAVLSLALGGGSGYLFNLAVGVLGLCLSVVMSVLSYHLFEKRFLNLKRRYTHVASAQTLNDTPWS